jgi:hypothetical protein
MNTRSLGCVVVQIDFFIQRDNFAICVMSA